MEFACQVWCPYYQCHIDRIESIQKRFLLFALSSLNWNDRFSLPKYENRLLLLDMNTLEHRRKLLNAMFVFKILNGSINCIFLLNFIKFRCPTRSTRFFSFIVISNSKLNYLNNEPLSLSCKMFNELFNLFDFNLNENCIKLNICNYFKKLMIT